MKLATVLSLATLSLALPATNAGPNLKKRIDQRKFRQGVATVFDGTTKKVTVGLLEFYHLLGALSGTSNSGTNGLIADGINDKIVDMGTSVVSKGFETQYIIPFETEEILLNFSTAPTKKIAAFDVGLVVQDFVFEDVWASALNTLSDAREKGIQFTMTVQDKFTKGI